MWVWGKRKKGEREGNRGGEGENKHGHGTGLKWLVTGFFLDTPFKVFINRTKPLFKKILFFQVVALMFKYIKESIHAKILIVIIAFMSIGVVVSVTYELRTKESALLEEKLRASRFMAGPVLDVIYEDMVEERADLARRLLKTLGRGKDVKIRIIRNNGVEEAFRDLKTIDKVRVKFGRVRPEWLAGHENVKVNVAPGTGSERFREAYRALMKDPKNGPLYYRDERGGHMVLTYLQPIERRSNCGACHEGRGARGIIMVTTPLDDMYAVLARNRKQWFVVGILCVFLGGIIISVLVKKTVTGPLRKKVHIIKRIAEGEEGISARLDMRSKDEMGSLAEAFNRMLERLQRRSQENRRLFRSVEKGKAEWMATFDSIHDLISIHDKGDRIIRVNTALAERCGKTPGDLIGKTCSEVFYGGAGHDALCPHRKTMTTGAISEVEVDSLRIEGTFKITTFPIKNETGGVRAVVHVARDITMEKDLGEKLLHAEKLSSMGKLVAGIAHELNNPLMGIMGFSQLLMDAPDDKKLGEVKGKLEKIYHESTRTAHIVQNLLTFARAAGSKKEYADVNGLIRDTLELREYSLRSNDIEVRLSLSEDLPHTMVDKYQMQQVFINIINNAEDAMLGKSGHGVLEIETRHSDGRIEITFSDDGPGVPREILGKVFDPFFTTKDVGRGTGLGLSITHGILAEHNGEITIENRAGGGALVRVSLPLEGAAGEVPDEGGVRDYSQVLEGRTVLLVEDEASIRESIAIFLEEHGLAVERAAGGGEALDALGKGEYDFVLTDLKMAGMNGVDLYKEATKKRPRLKKRFVMLTGDVFSEDMRAFFEEHGCPCLLKPFELPQLLEAMAGLLVGGRGDKGAS